MSDAVPILSAVAVVVLRAGRSTPDMLLERAPLRKSGRWVLE